MTWSGPQMQGASSSGAARAEMGQFVFAESPDVHPVPEEEVGQFSMGSEGNIRKKVTTSKKKKKADPKTDRTKWTDAEDELLVSAWLNVS